MKKSINISWKQNMAFEADIDGHKLLMDAESNVGGENLGPTPKPLLMVSLGGCTGMDVISIARKMKQEIESFDIEVVGDFTEEHPVQYVGLKLIYTFKGKDLNPAKLEKAITLSQDRYCGVTATLQPKVKIDYEIVIL
ncbi:MAG: OsmC family protein [Bacteroidota bacterium]|nr:OsmC family protein [Bacteroidota bacterium]